MAEFSIVVIAQNEESNIGHCVRACMGASDDVWVIDSFSTDRTVDICTMLGAHVVQHDFESWGTQRNYAMENLDLKHEYVLFLDADEEIDGAFASELQGAIPDGRYAAFNVNFDIYFLGKVLKHAHENPPVLRVVKRGCGRWLSEGAREYCVVDGKVGRIRRRIHHEDRKGIFFWLIKHIRNADREANLILKREEHIVLEGIPQEAEFERPGRVRLRRLFGRFPSWLRPGLLFFYRYVLRLGFLDGYAGFAFCVLQAYWYNFIIDLRVRESRLGHDSYLPTYGGNRAAALAGTRR
jgi:glycosyltransferase involved in cell wall biosynthesis